MIDDYAVKVHYITGDIHHQFVDGFRSKRGRNVDYDILLK